MELVIAYCCKRGAVKAIISENKINPLNERNNVETELQDSRMEE
jgi:hypothetical protein